MTALKGRCLCGAVVFEVTPPFREAIICHCGQCRRWAGHIWAASAVPPERFRLIKGDSLRWFRSSSKAERGFCATCGSSLFWRPSSGTHVSFAPGALDAPTGLSLKGHQCVASKGDYYDIPTSEPQE